MVKIVQSQGGTVPIVDEDEVFIQVQQSCHITLNVFVSFEPQRISTDDVSSLTSIFIQIDKKYLGNQNFDFPSRSPLPFFRSPKDFPAAGNVKN